MLLHYKGRRDYMLQEAARLDEEGLDRYRTCILTSSLGVEGQSEDVSKEGVTPHAESCR